MNYSTKFNIQEEYILDINALTVTFKLDLFKNGSLRDLFINVLTNPMSFFIQESNVYKILENINLQIKKGERVGLIGNNGTGKSTLCRLISGIYGNKKSIKINGEVRGIFDTEVAVFPELTGFENLELLTHLFFSSYTDTEKLDIIKDAGDFSELGDFLNSPFKIYSKGMRARLFLSLISSRPSNLLILDEVFNGADHFFSEKMAVRIKKAIFESSAVLFVSHSEELIKEVCNRVIVFHDKKIVFDGAPEEAYKFYYKNCHDSSFNLR